MKNLGIIGLVSFLVLVAGCGGGSDALDPQNQKMSGNFIGADSSEEKVAFIKALENDMSVFEDGLRALEQSAAAADDSVKGDLFLKIGELRGQLGQFKSELYVYGNSKQEGEEGKLTVEQSWRNLQQSYADVAELFGNG